MTLCVCMAVLICPDVQWEGEDSALEEADKEEEEATDACEIILPARVEIPPPTESSHISAMTAAHSSTPTSALAPSMLVTSPLPVDVSSSVDGSAYGSRYCDFSDIGFDQSMPQRPEQASTEAPAEQEPVHVIVTSPTVCYLNQEKRCGRCCSTVTRLGRRVPSAHLVCTLGVLLAPSRV